MLESLEEDIPREMVLILPPTTMGFDMASKE
jgi:hypothetical protein